MPTALRDKLGILLAGRWYLVLIAWLFIVLALKLASPNWNDVVKDGDFDYLPPDTPSRVGLETLRRAFPDDLSRSQLVVVFANPTPQMSLSDRCTMLDTARRLTWYLGKIKLDRLIESKAGIDLDSPATGRLRHILDTAIEFDEQWFDTIREMAGTESPLASHRLIGAYHSRLQFAELTKDEALANDDRITIKAFESLSGIEHVEALPFTLAASFEDIWTWLDPVLSNNLGSDDPHIKLLAVQLREEFMAVRNLDIVDGLQRMIEECRSLSARAATSVHSSTVPNQSMRIELTGAAAVGADLLGAAKFSVSQSEIYTVIAVIMTLLLIYRSPLLVFLPLLTIGVAFSVASSVLALAASLSENLEPAPLVQLYSTTRIFLVVLIFGIGTDLTLFFIVRCREAYFNEANPDRTWNQTVASSWSQVFGAIVGSGLTTAIGLSMMAASSFAKFRYSGIAISASIILTLIICVTLPIAILAGIGPKAFWPAVWSSKRLANESTVGRDSWIWTRLANLIVSRPLTILSLTVVILCVPAIFGWYMMNDVTYNFVGELSTNATSRQGQSLIRRYLPRIETSAITLCVTASKPFQDDSKLRQAIEDYRKNLFVEGVVAVQTLTDPLGEFPPDKRMSLFSQGAWRRRMLQNHPLTQQKFTSRVNDLEFKVARFEIVTSADPFSDEAAAVLARIKKRSQEIQSDEKSNWHASQSAVSGITASIVDLKRITQHDQMVVQILVTISVLIVLLVLTHRFELSIYLMFSVLFSYFATLGISQGLFWLLYGETFEGVDWKVPLFLFVILVAVGQDYNIYLTTRVLEEQKRLGVQEGLKHAIIITGGIITSCGLIMFATFAAMCWGSVHLQTGVINQYGWPIPALRGIGELGFALSFGVLLDTFVIRTIIVPAYVAWRKLA
jgi:RND superfamily putative drug exporter